MVEPTMGPLAGARFDFSEQQYVTHSLRGEGFDASEDGTGRGTPLVPIAIQGAATRKNPNSGPDGVGIRTDGIAYTLEARSEVQCVAFDTTQVTSVANRSNPKVGDPCHPLAAGAHPPAIAFSSKDHGADAGEISPTLRSMGHDGSHANGGGQVAVAIGVGGEDVGFALRSGASHSGDKGDGGVNCTMVAQTVTADMYKSGGATAGNNPGVRNCFVENMAVRRLTPKECSRLQGFPDGYLDIDFNGKPAADGPKYKAIGNSMAVPCMSWIGKRIKMVEELTGGAA